MLIFYKKALLALLGLLAICALATYWCLQRTFLQESLLPADTSAIPWEADKGTDAYQGGMSSVTLYDDSYGLDFELFVSSAVEYPHASVGLVFQNQSGEPTMVDLSSFTSLNFNVKCSPANVLGFAMFMFEEQVTQPWDYLTYRSPSTYFSCSEQWSHVELDLTRLETAQWWLDRFDLKLSMQEYQPTRVPRISFFSTFQSPQDAASRVHINELSLHGRDWRYLYLLGVFLILTWGGFAIWLFRQHTQALIRDLRNRVQKDLPLIAYQQLSVEPRNDRDKGAILRFMATEYSNPELNLDTIANAIGVSRTKINEVLKAELGYTFTGYLNKLRLTEAARLLSETEEASVAEIAYSVGYRNVSYFNKLFKEEYGCTPKIFKNVYKGVNLNS